MFGMATSKLALLRPRSRSITLREAARSLDATQAHVIALLATGHLRAVEGSGRLRIDRGEFDTYVRRRRDRLDERSPGDAAS